MPPFSGVDVFLILRVREYSVDYIVNGELVRGWRHDYVLENSDPIDEMLEES